MGKYLAKRLATIATLLDKSTPAVVALFDAIPWGEGGRWRGLGKTLLFHIACRLARRVLLTKLVELDEDICPYLATLMMATLVCMGETLLILEGMQIMTMTKEAFGNIFLKEAAHNYDNYRMVSW